MLASGLSGRSSETFEMETADLGKRWEVQRASDACNSRIEKRRWGSLSAMLSYEQREPDHGYQACMEGRLTKRSDG